LLLCKMLEEIKNFDLTWLDFPPVMGAPISWCSEEHELNCWETPLSAIHIIDTSLTTNKDPIVYLKHMLLNSIMASSIRYTDYSTTNENWDCIRCMFSGTNLFSNAHSTTHMVYYRSRLNKNMYVRPVTWSSFLPIIKYHENIWLAKCSYVTTV
jgi:hypothetical protein